ncbi:MAG: 6-bladed beta-propeller [Acidobacteriota bacterium]|nr:6-bladed beta-propeller [Acidobacteriota bacterium]
MILFLIILCLDADPDFETQQVFESIPLESDLFLRSVDDVAVAPDGRTYVLDGGSIRIHVWNAAGDYLTSFGRQGQGPGEFVFRNNSNALSFQGNSLYVFDSATGKVTVFDEEGRYLDAFFLEVGRRMVPLFAVVDPETLLVGNFSWEGPYRRLATYDTKGKLKRKLAEIEDKTWRYFFENGQRRVALVVGATTLITGYDETRDEVLIGDNATNKVQISDVNGKPIRELSLELVRRDMTREIQKSWEDRPWLKQQSFYKYAFSDKLPTYNRIVCFDEGFVFLLRLTPENGGHEGIVTDRAGKTLRQFDTVFGNGGGLYGSNGELITVRAGDMDDLSIYRVSAGKP